MNKYELVSYLSGLIAILDSKDDAGIARGRTLPLEYERAYKQLRDILDAEHKEHDNV